MQGQIPFVAEVDKLAAGSMHSKVLGTLNSVLDAIHEEVTAAEPKLAELAAAGASWLDDDDAAVYFEFEARPEHTCNVRSRRGWKGQGHRGSLACTALLRRRKLWG